MTGMTTCSCAAGPPSRSRRSISPKTRNPRRAVSKLLYITPQLDGARRTCKPVTCENAMGPRVHLRSGPRNVQKFGYSARAARRPRLRGARYSPAGAPPSAPAPPRPRPPRRRRRRVFAASSVPCWRVACGPCCSPALPCCWARFLREGCMPRG